MSREILIQTQKGERLVAMTERGRLDDFHIEVDRYQSLLGNIYKGRVESILPSINAAFINIGQEKNGFLYLTDVVSADPFVEEELSGPQKLLKTLFGKYTSKPASPEDGGEDGPNDNSTQHTQSQDQPPQDKEQGAPKEPQEPKEQSQTGAGAEAKEQSGGKEAGDRPSSGRHHRGRGSRGGRGRGQGRQHSNNNNRRKQELPFKVGDEILVQVVKDPFGGKGARLTTHITLPGRFVVYMPFDRQKGVSRKIEESEERQRLREIIKDFSFVKSGGYIIRTASKEQGRNELLRDAKFLYKIWLTIYKKAEAQKAPALIYEEGELTWKIVRDDFTDSVKKVVIDNEADFQKIRKFVLTLIGRQAVKKVEHYTGKQPLFEAKGIDKELRTIYETTVHVKSGAYIVIEPTEAITVVDVNSGRFKTKASPEEAAFMVNMEVVPEIARQLRFRDLGGIIVIDFIDMSKEDHRRKIHAALVKALESDYAKTEVYKISPLGLVEMTRARTGKNVESISFGNCPYCRGRGRVKFV